MNRLIKERKRKNIFYYFLLYINSKAEKIICIKTDVTDKLAKLYSYRETEADWKRNFPHQSYEWVIW